MNPRGGISRRNSNPRKESPAFAIIQVKVVPGSSRDRVAGKYADALKVQTSAAPEKGKANLSVAAILAEFFAVKPGQVMLISSPPNPRKQFRIAGLTQGEVDAKVSELG